MEAIPTTAKQTIGSARGTVAESDTVNIADGTYNQTGNLGITINKDMTIVCQSESCNMVVDAQHQNRIFI